MPQHSKEFSGIWSFDISNIIELFGKFKEFFLGVAFGRTRKFNLATSVRASLHFCKS